MWCQLEFQGKVKKKKEIENKDIIFDFSKGHQKRC